jgi:hypothetical protein
LTGPAPRRPGLALAAGLAAALAASGAAAQGPVEEDPRFEEPPTLPESLNGTVRRRDGAAPARVERIRDVFAAIQACWRPAPGSGFSGQEMTVRLAFKRSGEVLGQPRTTFYRAGTEASRREAFADSIRSAFQRCTPLPFSERLGAAVAGRPFTFRFVDSRSL